MDYADVLPDPSEEYQRAHPDWRNPQASGDDLVAPAFSDEALALKFSERHADDLRYVAAWGKWLVRAPAVWRFDDTVNAFDMARAVCREAAGECNDNRIAIAIASAKTVAAVERLAKADRRHAATVGMWDADPWLLNTPGGVVDLRTGQIRAHRPADHVTKITAVSPEGECPLWVSFLDRITGGDRDLRAFLQRVAGYSLTGITREHALFFGYGTGGNGKGVFLNTLTALMGGYATVASMETFTAPQGERHPTDLAMLRGARLVAAQETEEGRRWAESRIKTLTGGDPVTARFMRQDYFTYMPQFKLFIAGNHKPGLRNVDEAIRRRFHLIPFEVTIAEEECDHGLPEKLQAEWGGILAWAIAGCLEWQREGLAPPKAVRAATEDYLAAEDLVGNWISERCTTSGFGIGGSTELYLDWKRWAEMGGEQAGSRKDFSAGLENRSFRKSKLPDGKAGFRGIYLRPATSRAEPA